MMRFYLEQVLQYFVLQLLLVNGYGEIKVSEQQFQAEVMDELKMQDVMQEKLKQAYIDGWTKGMEDAAELLKTTMEELR